MMGETVFNFQHLKDLTIVPNIPGKRSPQGEQVCVPPPAGEIGFGDPLTSWEEKTCLGYYERTKERIFGKK
jgi:hypothetical protein